MIDTKETVAGSAASSCWAACGGVWYDIEDAPQDGTIIIGATYDRRHVAAIFMKYCEGDMEGGWVTERSHSPIRWNPQCWTIVPPNTTNQPPSAAPTKMEPR